MDRVTDTGKEVKTNAAVDLPGEDRVLVPSEIHQELTLTERAERSLIDRLQRMEDCAVIFERRAQLIETCYLVAIKRTRPQDWVLSIDPQGNEVGMLTASGADLVAEVYGIVTQNLRPLDDEGMFAPKRVQYPNGSYGLVGTCDALSRVNGRAVEGLEAARRSDEDFTGRSVDAKGALTVKPADRVGALDSDLRGSVLTLLRTKTVRVLCGMTRVPVSDLDRAWKGTDRKTADCRKGHGYGTSTDRKAQSVADPDVAENAQKLRAEILKRVGGDEATAKQLLKEITAGKDFKGFDSVSRLTQGWQVKNAWENLRSHKTFGDSQQGRLPGQEG